MAQLHACMGTAAAQLREESRKGEGAGPIIHEVEDDDEVPLVAVPSKGASVAKSPSRGRQATGAAATDDPMGEEQGGAEAAPPPAKAPRVNTGKGEEDAKASTPGLHGTDGARA